MSHDFRFHLDRGGHSITVCVGGARDPVEVLVDGKVVATCQRRRRGVTVLTAELPGDAPRPVTLRIDWAAATDGGPAVLLEAEDGRALVPRVSPTPVPGRDRASKRGSLQRLLRFTRR
ncbi:hypothetical protein JQK87_36185 [Streptomyces sp. G44]|uniref:hypothetical protein n=1 Tax=Streptomyces sp. G44 TaxID=2807632 RepID=UPI0019622565|nr:hypothetical protein [Streptomyces sp. G44]MBM7173726.1 hypothetical protein [Streptomyces sp. G44]